MKPQLKISIITPSFNSGKYIERAIKSVLTQDYKNWEHIIMDGGSTDNTTDILKKYPHLIWVSKKDNGQADAMNKGFNKSTGNIVVYLNADDYFYPKAFSSVIKAFEKGAKFVVGNITINSPRQKAKYLNTGRTTLEGMLRHWEPNSFCHNPVGYFYLKEVQQKCPFNTSNSLSMDLEFLLDAAEKYKFTKINANLGCFEDGSETKTTVSQSKLDYWQSSTFPYLEKHINKLSVEEKTKYLHDQRTGYTELQSRINIDFDHIKIFINQSKAPLVSIIIPTYNDKEHVCRAIESIFEQGLENIEIIVVDDASTDKTSKLLKTKYKNNQKVSVITHTSNKKLGAARNTGLKKAKGKYVFFVDSDDWLKPNGLIHLVSIAETYGSDVTACGVTKTWENGTEEKFHQFSFACKGGIEALGYLTDYMIGSIAWNKLYLRSFLEKEKILFISPYWHEDVNFSTQVAYKCKKYISISDVYYNYFQRPTSIVNGKQTLLHLKSYIHLLTDMNKFIVDNNLNNNDYLKYLSRQLFKAHCLNDFSANLYRYKNSRSQLEWESDLFNACLEEIPSDGAIMAEVINNFVGQCTIQISQVNNPLPVPQTTSSSITDSEKKIILLTRKLKHLIIPENSMRIAVFRKLTKHQ